MPVRPIRVEGDLAYVTLTQGYEAVIDAADAPFVGQFNWCAVVNCNTVYAYRRTKTKEGGAFGTLLHRFLLEPPKGVEVDHISRDGLDNRRANLRVASRAQNSWNSKPPSSNTSGYKNVTFCKRKRRWVVRISVGNKRLRFGSFPTPGEAHAAYVKACLLHHGEFARPK